MKIGLLSDVHGNAPALRAVLDVLLPRVEKVLFLGDMAGYYSFLEECMALWDEEKFMGVRGNHDEVLIRCLEAGSDSNEDYRTKYGSAVDRARASISERSRALIASWPLERTVKAAGKTLRMFHGAPWDPLEGRVYPDFTEWDQFNPVEGDIILLGHTHYPMVHRHQNKLIVNPGSVGQPRDRIKDASFAILDTAKGEAELCRVPYDAAGVIEDVKHNDPHCSYLAEVLVR